VINNKKNEVSKKNSKRSSSISDYEDRSETYQQSEEREIGYSPNHYRSKSFTGTKEQLKTPKSYNYLQSKNTNTSALSRFKLLTNIKTSN